MFSYEHLIWAFVSLIFAASILVIATSYIGITREAAKIEQAEYEASYRIREYREFNPYNGTTITAQDVIAFITQYRGRKEVVIYPNTFDLRPGDDPDYDGTSIADTLTSVAKRGAVMLMWRHEDRAAWSYSSNSETTLSSNFPNGTTNTYQIQNLNLYFKDTIVGGKRLTEWHYLSYLIKDEGGTIVGIKLKLMNP